MLPSPFPWSYLGYAELRIGGSTPGQPQFGEKSNSTTSTRSVPASSGSSASTSPIIDAVSSPDNGNEFRADAFHRLITDTLKGRHTFIRSGRPQTNGHVERLHRTNGLLERSVPAPLAFTREGKRDPGPCSSLVTEPVPVLVGLQQQLQDLGRVEVRRLHVGPFHPGKAASTSLRLTPRIRGLLRLGHTSSSTVCVGRGHRADLPTHRLAMGAVQAMEGPGVQHQ